MKKIWNFDTIKKEFGSVVLSIISTVEITLTSVNPASSKFVPSKDVNT